VVHRTGKKNQTRSRPRPSRAAGRGFGSPAVVSSNEPDTRIDPLGSAPVAPAGGTRTPQRTRRAARRCGAERTHWRSGRPGGEMDGPGPPSPSIPERTQHRFRGDRFGFVASVPFGSKEPNEPAWPGPRAPSCPRFAGPVRPPDASGHQSRPAVRRPSASGPAGSTRSPNRSCVPGARTSPGGGWLGTPRASAGSAHAPDDLPLSEPFHGQDFVGTSIGNRLSMTPHRIERTTPEGGCHAAPFLAPRYVVP
jgi:hypothetical protein